VPGIREKKQAEMLRKLNSITERVIAAIKRAQPSAVFQGMRAAGDEGVHIVYEARYAVHIHPDGNISTIVLLTDAKRPSASKAIPVQPSDIDDALRAEFSVPLQDAGQV